MLAAQETLPGLGDLGFPPSFRVSEERHKMEWEFAATGAGLTALEGKGNGSGCWCDFPRGGVSVTV